MAANPRSTTASPLTRSHDRVFILCGIALDPTWPALNPSVTNSLPAISRIVIARLDGAGRCLHECADDVEIERPRVDLPDAVQHPLEAEVRGDGGLERGELRRVAVEQVEHVLPGAHRALDAAQRVPRDQLLDPLERDQQLFAGRRESLAERGCLRRHVVTAADHHQFGVLGGEPGQPGERGDHPVANDHQRRRAPGAARHSR